MNLSNINTQTVGGHLGSHNTITYSEQHIHQTSGNEGEISVEVLLSQINAVITRPRTCRLDDPLKKSVRRAALDIPDLPVIEYIVSRSAPRTVARNDGHGSDLEATAAEILQVQSMVQTLFKLRIGDDSDEVPLSLWQTLAKIFGSLSSRFSDIGWYVGALRMSYHDVQIRCALANFQSQPTPADLSRSSILPAAPPYHVELLVAIAKLLHHRSVNSAHLNCFNDARKASKEAIRIQSELCIHEPENVEFKLALSWMQRCFASIRHRDGAYDADVFDIHRVLPADTTKFDEVRAVLRHLLGVLKG